MLTLPFALTKVIVALAPVFSQRLLPHVQRLLVGAILVPGTRTVTAVLRVMGMHQERQFQRYHRVLNRAAWSPLALSRLLLAQLVQAFVPEGPLVMGMDDTIERRRGAKIQAKGIYRDPVRSSHSHFVKTSGLRWLSLMLLVPIPWAGRVWALPFLTALSPSQRYYTGRGRTHQKLTDRARQVLRLVKRWWPKRELVIVADSSFAALELLDAVRRWVSVITRLRLDAALFESAPARQPGQLGRPRRKGARLPTLKQRLLDRRTSWQTVTVSGWYGQDVRALDLASGTAVWYHTGLPSVPIRWVLVRDPLAKFDPQAFLCTDTSADPVQILRWFVQRWQLEVTFEEARRYLGVETQRQWSNRAIARTTPALFGLYSVVTLMAQALLQAQALPVRTAAWYTKSQATFSDTIALVRRSLWRHARFSMSHANAEMLTIPKPLFERLTDTLCYAA